VRLFVDSDKIVGGLTTLVITILSFRFTMIQVESLVPRDDRV
jgi:hypothetical protein